MANPRNSRPRITRTPVFCRPFEDTAVSFYPFTSKCKFFQFSATYNTDKKNFHFKIEWLKKYSSTSWSKIQMSLVMIIFFILLTYCVGPPPGNQLKLANEALACCWLLAVKSFGTTSFALMYQSDVIGRVCVSQRSKSIRYIISRFRFFEKAQMKRIKICLFSS